MEGMLEAGPWRGLGWALLLAGLVAVVVGLALLFLDRVPRIGRLPGDLLVQRGRFTLFVPVTTMILLSLLLTLLLNLFRR